MPQDTHLHSVLKLTQKVSYLVKNFKHVVVVRDLVYQPYYVIDNGSRGFGVIGKKQGGRKVSSLR